MAVLVILYRIDMLIERLNAEALNQLRVHSSLWNFLADFGSSGVTRQFQACLTLVALILAWWVCFIAISVWNPYRWVEPFELMVLGCGMLCLGMIANCFSVAYRKTHRRATRIWLPFGISLSILDFTVAIAATTGVAIALLVERVV